MLIYLLSSSVLLGLCACATMNVGKPAFVETRVEITVQAPEEMRAGQSVEWTISWRVMTERYTMPPAWAAGIEREYEISLGGGATENVITGRANGVVTHTFTMVNQSQTESAQYQYLVRLKDENGQEAVALANYHVAPWASATAVHQTVSIE